jgi:hypothetical protein
MVGAGHKPRSDEPDDQGPVENGGVVRRITRTALRFPWRPGTLSGKIWRSGPTPSRSSLEARRHKAQPPPLHRAPEFRMYDRLPTSEAKRSRLPLATSGSQNCSARWRPHHHARGNPWQLPQTSGGIGRSACGISPIGPCKLFAGATPPARKCINNGSTPGIDRFLPSRKLPSDGDQGLKRLPRRGMRNTNPQCPQPSQEGCGRSQLPRIQALRT